MSKFTSINGVGVGDDAPLLIIAGPCLLESKEVALRIASTLQSICIDTGVGFIFKGSFDKANRTSVHSNRGPGIDAGLDILHYVKEELQITQILIEHEIRFVMDLADRIAVLDFGQKIADGKPAEIRSHQGVIDAYLGAAREITQ